METATFFHPFFLFLAFAVQFPISLRLKRLFSENFAHPESRDAEQLRMEVAENVRGIYFVLFIGGLVCLYHLRTFFVFPSS